MQLADTGGFWQFWIAIWGIAATVGNLVAGGLTDRLGSRMVINLAIVVAGIDFALMPLSSMTFLGSVVALVVWGLCGWGMLVPQQHRLISIAPTLAPILLALNAATIYVAVSVSGLLGAVTLQMAKPHNLGLVGAVLIFLGLGAAELARRDHSTVVTGAQAARKFFSTEPWASLYPDVVAYYERGVNGALVLPEEQRRTIRDREGGDMTIPDHLSSAPPFRQGSITFRSRCAPAPGSMGCNTIVFGELDWSPQVHAQCAGDAAGGRHLPRRRRWLRSGRSRRAGAQVLAGAGIVDPLSAPRDQHTDVTRIRQLTELYLQGKVHLAPPPLLASVPAQASLL